MADDNQKLIDAVVARVNQKMNSTYSPEATKLRRLENEVRSLRSKVSQLEKLIEEKLG